MFREESDPHAGITRALVSPGRLKEKGISSVWFLCAIFAVVIVFFILFYLLIQGIPAFDTIGFLNLIFGQTWNPTGAYPSYGAFPLIVGTILVTAGALAIAVPLGIGSAIYIAELADTRVKSVIKPAIELLAGIPSVVYGFFGLIVLTNWLRITFEIPSGQTWLAGSILLGIMALPTIISVAEDAISAVPREYREGSLAIGANRWQTISRVIIPGALSGITAAIILGMGRALGETMAVLMVCGNAAIIPSPIWNVLSPIRTLTATLGIEMGEVPVGSLHYQSLFAVAVILLGMTLVVNLFATRILQRIRQMNEGVKTPKRRLSFEAVDRLKRGFLVACVILLAGFLFIAAGPLLTVIIFAILAGIYLVWTKISARNAQRVAFVLIIASVGIVLFFLGIILFDIISKGIGAISWEFLTQSPRDLGRAGGIFPAIVGTLYLVAGAILIALPLGVGAAIYLSEYTRGGRVTQAIRTGVDLLNGTPSIVFGLFGFAFLVLALGIGVSLLAGQITLALMVLPTIIRTTEEALKTVPLSVREGSLALGATKWQTISRVVLSPATPGILTGMILSIGRAAGETAPILFTAVVFSQRYLPSSVFSPVMALPYHLFVLATSIPGAETNEYGTALVLLLLVIGIYAVAIVIRNHFHKKIHW